MVNSGWVIFIELYVLFATTVTFLMVSGLCSDLKVNTIPFSIDLNGCVNCVFYRVW